MRFSARTPILAAAFAVLFLGPLSARADAQTVTVTSTADSGPGSLREAIGIVNAGSANVIDMTALAGSISLLSNLPAILNPVTINGNPGGLLDIDGNAAGGVLLNAGASVTLNDFTVLDGFAKAGTGTLAWNGLAQFYFGATSLQTGTLSTITSDFLSATSPVTLGAGTLLDLTDTEQEVGSLEGPGDVALGEFGELSLGGLDTDTTFSGSITGGDSSALEKLGTGTFTLDGGSVEVSWFDVVEGTVVAASTDALAGVEFLEVEDNAALTLGADQTIADTEIYVAEFGALNLGANTLTLGGSSFFEADGTINGTGGTLRATDDAYFVLGQDAIDGDVSIDIHDDATVEIEGHNTVRGLSGTGGLLFLCFCSTLTVDQDIDTTFAGNIEDDDGGALVKDGTGRLTLTGSNSYTGGTTVLGGVLEGTTNSLQGAIANEATVEFNQTIDGDFGGTISGTGALVKSGTALVNFISANSYTGGTIVDAGTLVVGADGALGSGSLTMNGGTLQVDFAQDVTSLSGAAGIVQVDGELGVDQDGDTTFGGVFTGTGLVAKLGDGMLTLTGASTFSGTVGVLEGTLALGGTGDAMAVAEIGVVDGAELRLLSDQTLGDVALLGTLAVGAHTLTWNTGVSGSIIGGNITGDGAIVVGGLTGIAVGSSVDFSGTLTLTGNSASVLFADNAFANASSVTINDNAYLELEGAQTFAALAGNGGEVFLCDCAALTVDQSADTTFAGMLSGDAGSTFVKAGSGRLMLSGDTSQFFGALAVTGGVLAGTTDSLTGDIDNLGTVEFDQDGDGAFDGVISGTGAVVKSGAGTVELITANSHTGGTTIAAGMLVVDDPDALGSGALTVDGGTLAVGGVNDVRVDVTALSGSGGVIDIGDVSTLSAEQAGDTAYAGALTGGGWFVKAGAGTLSLTGSNTITGAVDVQGGVLSLDAENTLADVSVVIVSGSTLRLGADQSLHDIAVLPGATIDLGAQTLTLEAGAGGIILGAISGAGDLVVGGNMQVALFGQNTYGGGTTVRDNAVLSLRADDVLAAGSALVINDNAAAVFAGHQTLGSLSGDGGAVELCACSILTINQAIDTTFAGDLSEADMGGSGFGAALVKSGAGTLTLTGTSSYTGGTTVTGGTLAGTTASLQGNILNAAIVSFDQQSSGTFSGAITGSGSVVKTGGGTLLVTGEFDHSGGTFVLGGTLSGSAQSLGGTIVNQARVEFVQGGVGVFDGVITGTGSVTTRGSGTVVFDHANGYSGGTTIAGGTLRVASDASLGAASGALTFAGGTLAISADFGSARDLTLDGSGTFDTSEHTAVLAGAISGAGSLTKAGSGVLLLTGTASHTGGTNVLGGVLAGSASNLLGAIRNDATVVFAQAIDGTFDGAMSGTGALLKSGAGLLTINGAQTHTGVTSVVEGALELGGSLAGSVFVGEGASFGGSGSVAGDVFAAGRISAGSFVSIGGAGGGGDAGAGAHAQTAPMRIDGDLLLAGSSTYEAHVAEDASIATMAIGGRAVIDGATLHLIETTAGILSPARRQTSTVLTAAEIVGGFGAITGLDAAFDPHLLSIGNTVTLMLVRNNVDFASFASTLNGSGVGAALAAAQTGATGDIAYVVRELSALETDEELADALERISGAAHASFAGISMIGSADVIDVLTSRFSSRGGWWAQGLGSSLSLDADVDPGESSAKTRGLMAGYDRSWTRAMAGLAGGYHDTGVDAAGGLDRVDGRAYRGALYGEYRAGRIVVDAVVSAATHRVRGSRAIRFAAMFDSAFGSGLLFGGVDRASTFDYTATEISGVLDAGYVIDVAGFRVQPSAGAQLTRISREAFAETGADSLSLTAAAATASSLAGRARLAIERRFEGAARRWVAPRASVRYTRELRDRDVPFSASVAGSPFTANGFALPASLLSAKAGVAAGFGAISFSLDYRAAFAAGQRHHLISAGFGF